MPASSPRPRSQSLPAVGLPRPVRLRYYVLWKPFGVLAGFGEEEGRLGLRRYVPLPGLFPVGRMDAETEGLLLLTDDPRLCTRLAQAGALEPRLWLAQVDGQPDPGTLDDLRRGPALGHRTALPLEARVIPEPELPARPVPIRHRPKTPTCWLELRVFEGWSRHVRRLTAALGHPTLRLVQWALGPVDLAGMVPGQLRELSPQESRWAEKVAAEAPERKPAVPPRNRRAERLAWQGRSVRREEPAGEAKPAPRRPERGTGQKRASKPTGPATGQKQTSRGESGRSASGGGPRSSGRPAAPANRRKGSQEGARRRKPSQGSRKKGR